MFLRGNYEVVCKIVNDLIIGEMKCMSLQSLLQNMDPFFWPKQYRHKLKSHLLETYGEKLLFVTAEENSLQVVISKQCSGRNATSIRHSDEFVVKEAANILKRAVLQNIADSPDVPWLPTVTSLQSHEPPEILKMFYDKIVKSEDNHHRIGITRSRIMDSFCSDVMFAVSNRKFLTLKMVAFRFGLHSKTGMKSSIELLHRLGHCISYDQVNLIETAQAELVQQYNSISLQLPLVPCNPENKVSTIFYV